MTLISRKIFFSRKLSLLSEEAKTWFSVVTISSTRFTRPMSDPNSSSLFSWPSWTSIDKRNSEKLNISTRAMTSVQWYRRVLIFFTLRVATNESSDARLFYAHHLCRPILTDMKKLHTKANKVGKHEQNTGCGCNQYTRNRERPDSKGEE